MGDDSPKNVTHHLHIYPCHLKPRLSSIFGNTNEDIVKVIQTNWAV